MAESFMKTFKRDYVIVHYRLDARSVLAQLQAGFEDFHENYFHIGLQMNPPRQFICLLVNAGCAVLWGNSTNKRYDSRESLCKQPVKFVNAVIRTMGEL